MSTKSSSSKTTKNKNKNKSVTALIAALTFCIGVIGGGIGGYVAGSTNNKDNSSITDSNTDSDSSNVENTNTTQYTNITDASEVSAKVKELNTLFDTILEKPVYFNLQISASTYEGYMYNPKGESIAQASDGSYTTVFTNNGHSVMLSDDGSQMNVDTTIDLISICRNTINALDNNVDGVSLKRVESDTESTIEELEEAAQNGVNLESIQEYVIDLDGETACKQLYSNLDSEYADRVIKGLKDLLGEDWNPHMEVGFIWDDKNQLALYCNIIYNGGHESNWICVGYGETPEWELPEEWYTADYKTNDDETNQALADLVADTTNYLAEVLGMNDSTSENNADNIEENNTDSSSSDESTSE